MARCYACPKDLGEGGILTEDGRLLCSFCEKREKQVGKSAPAYGTSELWKSSLVIPIIVIGSIGLLGFSILFFRGPRIEKTPPMFVNVPVEKIVNVPMEVVKERIVNVPVEKVVVKEDPEADIAKNFRERYIQAITEGSCPPEKVFWNVPSLGVKLYVGDKLADVLDESSLRTMIELRLRNNGITVDNSSRTVASFNIEGIWDDKQNVCTFAASTRVCEHAVIFRQGISKNVFVDFWTSLRYGYSGRAVIKSSAKEAFEGMVDQLANIYLASNPKK